MKIPESLKKYESVATIPVMRGLIDTSKRLLALSKNRLVMEYIELEAAMAETLGDLDAKIPAETDEGCE